MNKHIPVSNFAGKELLMTGAARRVGADAARYLAGRGVNLNVHYHSSRDAAEALKKEIESEGIVQVNLVTGDLSKEEDVKAMCARSSPDAVVHNAGTFSKDFEKNIEVNMRSAYYLCKYSIERALADDKELVIILTLDGFLMRGGVYDGSLVGYMMAKKSLEALIVAFAVEYGHRGIRVLGIASGPIQPTPEADQETIEMYRRQINMPQTKLDPWIGGERIGEAIFHLLHMTAVNGVVIPVDGGRVWKADGKEHKK